MDIGREVRRYRAEPLTSPVPGAAPAPEEPAATRPETPTLEETTEETVEPVTAPSPA